MKRQRPEPLSDVVPECRHTSLSDTEIPVGYFRPRDFEYVQPLYDLAFLLEADALMNARDVPKYRTFSLWRAAYSLDGYAAVIDQWLDENVTDTGLDYVPSSRIRQYLEEVRRTGTLGELRSYRSERYKRCLRLRSIRGLGTSQIAAAGSQDIDREKWLGDIGKSVELPNDRIAEHYDGKSTGPWQTAHIVPPLLRFLNSIEKSRDETLAWDVLGISDPFEPVTQPVRVIASASPEVISAATAKALRSERHFRRHRSEEADGIRIQHQMGWSFVIDAKLGSGSGRSISELATSLDPLACTSQIALLADLHLHTAWSDGSASVNTMADAVAKSGLQYFAVTDHSRSSKLQGGLTPVLWLRQANALSLATPVCPVLHGIEVDILRDGTLDLPSSLLSAADLVVGSVHSSWSEDTRVNSDRLIKAVESGCIDVLAHPTSALTGKPGVPNYLRPPAPVDWERVFRKCAEWRVALELNCFPSRLDLSLDLLGKAVAAGCAISLGSDAHARSHLHNLRFGEAALRRIAAPLVLNRFSHEELIRWIADSRSRRATLAKSTVRFVQGELLFEPTGVPATSKVTARIEPPQKVPAGSRIIGLDLTAGDKPTGAALLDGFAVETCSLSSDDQIIAYVLEHRPEIVSIDSPLGLPGGGDLIDPQAGIVRVAESDLASVGIPAYPALIDSMQKLTLRGMRLRKAIAQLPTAPRVIESYPGAAQDILCIPRKQKSLELLREGLRRLGLVGAGLDTRSHDEMDAITSAIVGRYFESGRFEPMGIPSEAQLIVPKVYPLLFEQPLVICLAGKTGAGKSVVARYLSVFYGFSWIRTRDLIRDLLMEDIAAPQDQKLWQRPPNRGAVSEADLREFGALILNVHKQVPLRRQLTKTISRNTGPVVVDSIRDLVDVDRQTLQRKVILTWFVDCSESLIQQRLLERGKMGHKRIAAASPVDRTAGMIRSVADFIVPNSGSLEELRWRIDDTLFSFVALR